MVARPPLGNAVMLPCVAGGLTAVGLYESRSYRRPPADDIKRHEQAAIACLILARIQEHETTRVLPGVWQKRAEAVMLAGRADSHLLIFRGRQRLW